MERKIGEIFEFNGEWYQCIIGHCNQCCFDKAGTCKFIGAPYCAYRNDKKLACFKKLEKVGEPIVIKGKRVQLLKSLTLGNNCSYCCFLDKNKCLVPKEKHLSNTFYVEIKQNKEDMEEKKLKPFDLQKAREGKSVCTRDGRKARIICFDRKHIYEGQDYSIVALINEGSYSETVCSYTKDGLHTPGRIDNNDLMMPSEKKEGWAKVRKDINLYDTKEEADRKMIENDEYVTAICWEE